MARIGTYELGKIKGNILDALYNKKEQELEVRKTAIAKQSRKLYLEPLQYLLDQLPAEMVCHDKEYCLRVKYTPNKDKTEIMVDEKWRYKTDINMMNPQSNTKGGSYYSSTPENTLDPRLESSASELCSDILALRIEKQKMDDYLRATIKKYTGSLQLRKVWPEVFHKYLPPEPVKVSKPKLASNKISIPDPTVPTTLKTRLTTNLLEGE